jgi:hypothetical protein
MVKIERYMLLWQYCSGRVILFVFKVFVLMYSYHYENKGLHVV